MHGKRDVGDKRDWRQNVFVGAWMIIAALTQPERGANVLLSQAGEKKAFHHPTCHICKASLGLSAYDRGGKKKKNPQCHPQTTVCL